MKRTNCSIEDLLALSITTLKRLGLLARNGSRSGRVEWNQRGRVTASMFVETDTTGEVPLIRFVYNWDGSPVDYSAPLRFTPSNLNRGGYYYFVCPITGRSCRKLYLVAGRFVSRFAFRAPYGTQRRGRAEREGRGVYAVQLSNQAGAVEKYRKKYYSGKLTPYGRKREKLEAKALNAERNGEGRADGRP